MPISAGNVNYPILNWDEANPRQVGLMKGNQYVKDFISTLSSGINLKNQQAKIDADLQEKLAETQLKKSQAPYYDAETKWLPVKYLNDAEKTAQSQSRFGPGYQLAKWFMTDKTGAEASQFKAEHPGGVARLKDSLASKMASGGEGGPTGEATGGQMPQLSLLKQKILDKLMRENGLSDDGDGGSSGDYGDSSGGDGGQDGMTQYKQKRLADIANVDMNRLQQQVPQQQQQNGQSASNGLQQGDPSNDFLPKEGELDRNVLIQQDNANNAAATTDMKKRKEGAVILEKWLQNTNNKFPDGFNKVIDRYSGAKGHLQLLADKHLSRIGKEAPEEYALYNNLNQNFKSSLLNQVRRMEGMGKTNEMSKELDKMEDTLKKLPFMTRKTARSLLNQNMQTFADISEAAFNTTDRVYPGTTRKLYGLNPYSNEPFLGYDKVVKESDIQHTMANKGIKDRDAVIKQLKDTYGNNIKIEK